MTEIDREDVNDCAVLTLNRPQVLNAINEALINEFERQLDSIEQEEVRVVIITGRGKGFCSGTDLREMLAIGEDLYAKRIDRMHSLVKRLQVYPCPTIAAIHGPALGGGVELASACTFRIAENSATFALPEIRLGVMPCYGGTQFITRLIGEGKALELMLTGRTIDATHALSIGLINRLVPPEEKLLTAALSFSSELTAYSQIPQMAIRNSVAAVSGSTIEKGLLAERRQSKIAFNSEDAREGVAAFLEKRQALFRDR